MTKLMFNFVFLSLKRWFQSNSKIVGTHFASVMNYDCRKTKLHFQMEFLLLSTSCWLKLSINNRIARCTWWGG